MKRNKWLIIEIIAGIVLVVLIAFFVLRKLEDRRFIEEQQKLKMTMI